MILPRELKDLYSSSLIKPIGSQNPKFYLLVDPVQSYSISPISDQYFQSIIQYLVKSNLIIDDLDFLSKFRISSCVPFAPQELCEDSSWKKRDRQSSDEDLMNFKEYVLEDINKSNPEVIIVCGSNSAKLISDFKFNSSEEGQEYSSNLLFKYNEIPVIFCKSIREIFKSNSDTFLRKELASFTGKIIQAINLSKNINTLQTNTKWETLDVFDINELSRLTEIFKDDIKLVLDYETSGLNTNLKGFHLGVVGLCNLDCTKSVILYFSDLFRSGTENKPPKESLEFLNSFFSTKKFVVFNRMFECAVTNSPAIGINFNLKECEDVLMWLRCLAESSSLKDAASSRLGINKWNDSTEEWIECINNIVKNQKPTASMKGQREEIQWMIDNCTGLFEIKEYFKLDFDKEVIKELKKVIKDSASKINELKLTEDQLNRIKEFTELNKIRLNSTKEHQSLIKEFKELAISDYFEFNKGKEIFLSKKDNSFLDTLKTLKKICHKFFKEDEFDGVNLELRNYIIELLQNHHSFEYASYADIPLAIISPYCIADCNYTAKLYHLIKLELEEKNLIKAAEVYNRQAYLGYVLVRNGIAWDDKLASDLKIEYQNTQLESLRSLITLPAMLKVLDLDPKTILTVRSTTDLDLLKLIFNPMSSYKYTNENEHKSTSVRMSKVLGTPRFKLASLLYDVYLFSKEIEDVNECLKEFPTLYPIFKEITALDSASAKLGFLDSLLLDIKRRISDSMVENQLNYYKKYNKSPQEVQERLKYKGWTLESISHEHTEYLYRIFETIMGVDSNDDTNWPEEFWALYYFKLVKKTDKSIGTYLEGSIGRDSVEIVKKSDIQKECTLRLAKYYDREKTEDEVYINRSSFGVASVTTKRWQSAQHTVPKATELMDLRCSRYDDGIKLHWDQSQSEVRVLAILSGDENLLAAFRSGIDVHTFNAAKMWNKAMEDVTPTERSMAKGLTFSLLYGASLSEFANNYTKGNLLEARNIIDSFYRSYPKVKEFIKRMHRQGTFTGTVPTIFGDPIYVEMPIWVNSLSEEDKLRLAENSYDKNVTIPGRFTNEEEERKERAKFSKALRNSQNYCIQSSSSSLAADAIAEFQDKIEEENLSTKLECFTHDSCDSDLRIKDLIRSLQLVPICTTEYLERTYGVPMKIDCAIGVSNNQMVGLEEVQIQGNTIKAHFSGAEHSLELLKKKIEDNNGTLNYSVSKTKDVMISTRDLFLTKNAYAKSLGKSQKNLSGELEITI